MNFRLSSLTAALVISTAPAAHAIGDMRSHVNCDYFTIKVWTEASLNESIPMYWTNSFGLYTVEVTSVQVLEQGSPYNQLVPYEYEEGLWNASTKLVAQQGTNNWNADPMTYIGAEEGDNSVRWKFTNPPAIGGQTYFKITQAKGTRPFVLVNYKCTPWNGTVATKYSAWFPINLVP